MSYGYPGPEGEKQPPPPPSQPPPPPPPPSGQPGQPEWQPPYPPPPGQQPGWQQPGAQWQQPGQGWGAPPPPPPRGNKTGLIVGLSIAGVIVLTLVTLGVIGVIAVGDDDSSEDDASTTATSQNSAPAAAEESVEESTDEEPADESGSAEGDVEITDCEVDSLTSWASAEVQITNSTSETADYIVTVEFVNKSGKRLGDGLAAASDVAPGQTARETAQGLDTITESIECKVTDVTRYSY